MKTDLNEKVEEFFARTKLEEITIKKIKKHFKDINEVNAYGGLIHAAVHKKYPEEKVLKFIDVLLENGVDVNLQGEYTGYSFIHLALYGYTDDDDVDHSYTTEFIVKLINLGKKYNLDLGIVDNDYDSLIHTALASEDYEGSVISLIDALGPDFYISCKDGNGNDIYQALLQYKKEAIDTNNEAWLNKLTKEEEEIKRIVEVSKYDLEEISIILHGLRDKLNELTRKTDINYILENYNEIEEFHKRIDYYVNIREMITNGKSQNRLSIWEDYNDFLKKTISNYVEELSNKPDLLKIEELIKVVICLDFSDIGVTLEEMKKSYQKRIDFFKEKLAKTELLGEIEELEEELANLGDNKIKDELKELLIERKNKFEGTIGKIKKQLDILILVNVWLEGENKEAKEDVFMTEIDYLNMSLEELVVFNIKLEKVIGENKNLIKQVFVDKMEEIFNSISELSSSDIFEESELLEVLEDSIKSKEKRIR